MPRRDSLSSEDAKLVRSFIRSCKKALSLSNNDLATLSAGGIKERDLKWVDNALLDSRSLSRRDAFELWRRVYTLAHASSSQPLADMGVVDRILYDRQQVEDFWRMAGLTNLGNSVRTDVPIDRLMSLASRLADVAVKLPTTREKNSDKKTRLTDRFFNVLVREHALDEHKSAGQS